MVFVTAAWLVLLGILGMAPLPELPINDKALHFFGVSRLPCLSQDAHSSRILSVAARVCDLSHLLHDPRTRVSWTQTL